MTGINFFNAELVAKRLELLRELVPAATRVAVLVNPTNVANTEATLRDVEPAARAMGLQIKVFHAGTSREIDAAFAGLGMIGPTRSSSAATPFQQPARPTGQYWRRATRSPHDIRS